MNRILTENNGYVLDCLMDGRKAVELRCDSVNNDTCIGNIYIGRVRDVVPSVGAAFVDIGLSSNVFLPFSEIGDYTLFTKKIGKKLVCEDEELLIQVEREPIKTKPAAATSKISIAGRYCVVIRDLRCTVNFSKKISDAEWKKSVTSGISSLDNLSVIIRTNAYTADPSVIYGEVNELIGKISDICKTAPYRSASYTPVYEALPGWLTDIRDTADATLERIITDSDDLYQKVTALGSGLKQKTEKYSDTSYPLMAAFGLEKAVSEATNERVWMNSGAYLVIQPTEALTVIDVNSGKSERGKAAEDSYLKVNMEAAGEIARQMRLRNMSGIIIVDFINMTAEENNQKLLGHMRELLRHDPVTAAVAGISNLGLVEITRKKVRRPLTRDSFGAFFDKKG